MAKRAQVSIKKPEAERENKVSQIAKTRLSQSISSPVEQILFLQRTIGNQAVGRLIKSGILEKEGELSQAVITTPAQIAIQKQDAPPKTKSPKDEVKLPEKGIENKEKQRNFDLIRWFNKFKLSVIFTLSRFYIAIDEVHIKQVESFKDDDQIHPAYYDPNERSIYFSNSGFACIYDENVLRKKNWTEEKYEDFVIETSIEEAFHAYQDAPIHRSKKFHEYIQTIKDQIFKELMDYAESGIIDSYDKFIEYVPVYTRKYLPESKIKDFIGENLPGLYRDLKWQMSARQEIMNQWLKIMEDNYIRARGMSAFKKIRTEGELKEEKKHDVSLIEKQASKFSKMKGPEVKLWLLSKELENEKDKTKQEILQKKINNLRTEIDKNKINELEKTKKKLEAEFMKLDFTKANFSKADLERSGQIAKELLELGDRIDAIKSLNEGIETVFKGKKLLLP